MKFLVSLIAMACLASFEGCVPLGELEQENVDLQARVDSLQDRQLECNSQLATLATRIEVLEKENLKVETQNKQLTARLAETGSLPTASVEPLQNPPVIAAPSEPVQQSGKQPEPRTGDTPGQPMQSGKNSMDRRSELTNTYIPPVQSISSDEPADEAFLGRYQAALSEFNNRRYAEAIRQFDALLSSSKANDMTDNCAYWIGEALFATRSYREAIPWFNKILVSRGSDKIDDALMMRGNCYLQLDLPSKAAEDFQRIINEFPNGEFMTTARAKLRSIRTVPKGAHVSPRR